MSLVIVTGGPAKFRTDTLAGGSSGELAELENRVILRLSGKYILRRECELIEMNMHKRVESLSKHILEIDSGGD
jgi:hypothetical protein